MKQQVAIYALIKNLSVPGPVHSGRDTVDTVEIQRYTKDP